MKINTINIKRSIITLFVLSFAVSIFSQTAKESKGQKYYNYYNYYDAIKKLEPLSDKSKDVKLELAVSYFRTAQYEKSEKYYNDLVTEEKDADIIYDYVKVLLINQKYKEAEKWMKEFQKLAPNDTRAILFASDKGFYKELSKNKNYFSIKNLDFNTDAQDFAPSFYKNKIVFSSSVKKETEIIKRRWAWNHKPYLDLQLANFDSTSMNFTSIERFGLNKKFHEATVAFNKTGDFMILTANNYKQKSKEKEICLGMYYSNFKDGKWQKTKAMPFNNKEYSVGHPSLSKDGKTLYFVSDMPDGVGGVDIYYATLNDDGTWSEPKNLGKDVNTEGNEMFPFIHKDGYLFFASDGHPGLGGLDMFVTKLTNNKAGVIQNLMTPINTNFDDFAFILTDDMKRGYFSSNRITGKGSDDIYGFDLINPFFASKILAGTTVDKKDNSILSGVEVSLFNNDGKLVKQITTKEDGAFSFEIDPDKKYSLEGKIPEYNKGVKKIDAASIKDAKIETKLELEKIPVYNLHFLVLDYDTKKPIKGANVKCVNKNNENDVIKFVTNEKGEYFKEIKGLKLNSVLNYSLNISKNKYVASSKDLKINLDKEGQIELIEELAKMKVGIDLGKVLNLKPIYFDLNKSNIKPDAAIELDKIVKAMNENQTMKIELGSHSDSRGSARANALLSKKRANSSVKYVRQRIKNPKRIYGKGYGESKPLVVTKEINAMYPNFKVGAVLNDRYINKLKNKEDKKVAYQLNRRTEFKIIRF